MAINSNPFLPTSKAYKFIENCNIDYNSGFSDIISYDILLQLGLQTTNGGDWCRSDGPLGKIFNIHRKKEKGKIISVQLVGYNKNQFNNIIDNTIKDYYKNNNCSLLAIKGKNIEIDHKDGRKDDYKLHDNQTIDDFQPLHKTVNIAKREHCYTCKNTGLRFDAKQLGYSVSQFIGTEHYTGSCIGCFWHDIQNFNKAISKNFIKTK